MGVGCFLEKGGRIGYANYSASNWIDHETVKKDGLLHSSSSASNNIETLLRDIQLLRPSAFAAPPRIWSGLFYIFSSRVATLSSQNSLSIDQIKDNVRKEILDIFGPHLVFICTGGAPTTAEVKTFVRWCFPESVAFSESYGATECGAITENGLAMSGVDIRLEALPERGFSSASNVGEILVRTKNMSSGYLDPELTKISFDADGFFHTGDLGTFDSSGRLQILERVNAVISVDGHFVFPTQLEELFQHSPLISDIYICLFSQNPHPPFLYALVRPISDDVSLLDLEADILRLSLEHGLAHYSIPRILISNIQWTVSNGLLNIHYKKNRSALDKFLRSLIIIIN